MPGFQWAVDYQTEITVGLAVVAVVAGAVAAMPAVLAAIQGGAVATSTVSVASMAVGEAGATAIGAAMPALVTAGVGVLILEFGGAKIIGKGLDALFGTLSTVVKSSGTEDDTTEEASSATAAATGVKLTKGGKSAIGTLAADKDKTVAQVIKERGGGGSQVQEAGHWAQETLGDCANAAAAKDASAVTALKIAKDAKRLAGKIEWIMRLSDVPFPYVGAFVGASMVVDDSNLECFRLGFADGLLIEIVRIDETCEISIKVGPEAADDRIWEPVPYLKDWVGLAVTEVWLMDNHRGAFDAVQLEFWNERRDGMPAGYLLLVSQPGHLEARRFSLELVDFGFSPESPQFSRYWRAAPLGGST